MSYLEPTTWDETCVECGAEGSKVLDAKEAEVYCGVCGTVSEMRLIDNRPEHQVYTDDTGRKEDPSHAGLPQKYASLFGPALGCMTDSSTTFGKRLAKIGAEGHRMSPSGKQPPPRGVVDVIKAFDHVLSASHIPDSIRHTAGEMFAEFIAITRIVGSGRKTAYAACIYYTSNAMERKRSKSEIERDFGIGKEFAATCNKVQDALVHHKQWAHLFLDRSTKGSDLVHRMVLVQPKIPDHARTRVMMQCDKIWNVLNANDILQNENPQGVNIAVIFVACVMCDVAVDHADIMTACRDAKYEVCKSAFKRNQRLVRDAVCRFPI
ncbi:putative transcription initiation factor IIB-like protein [Tetrabaena socialis]|uniref:General transcription factor TFIIB n=1 Tax=Tetrabaena socialis TaxID=47790 RepID=A0A2J7ZZX8_9CHLO|nr:putative transcription initiation factor IIB-like protein [Tetrabaena socialis]|eukprot:PNH05831.1 putative transcription initiation factor IIB-like protein [Tetrabaena socialis]